ncbi:MAG: hypothetical protein JWL73_2791, partial [Actinomycetia bacterium]|nr:hypothetical protein [Actinomycetes bacterium]
MITLSDGAGGPAQPPAPPNHRRRVALILVVVGVVAVAVGGAFVVAGGSGDSGSGSGAGSTAAPTSSPGTSASSSPGGQTVEAATTSFSVGPTRPDLLKDSGPITVTEAGTVISNVRVNGTITIAADNVTVRNFVAGNVVQSTKGAGVRNTVLENGTINGGNSTTNTTDGVAWSNYTARNLDISKSFDGMKAFGNVTIENCWIHDLNMLRGDQYGAGGYSHNDGIQTSAGTNITIRDNRIERPGANSAIFIDSDQGRIDDVQITGNYLDGGGYTLYVVQSRSAPQNGSPANVTVQGNVFGKNHNNGPVTLAPGVTFRDNVDSADQPVPMHVDD